MKLKKLVYNIKTRLILVITLIIVFIATVISYVLYNYANGFLEEKMANLTTDNLLKYSSNLSNILQDSYHTALKTIADPQVIDRVSQMSAHMTQELGESLHKRLQEEVIKQPYIYSIYIYETQSQYIITSNALRKKKYIKNEEDYPWIEAANLKHTNLLSLVEYQDHVGVFDNFFYAVVKPIENAEKEDIGTISVNLNAKKIYDDFLVNMTYEEGSDVMLVNREGVIISHERRDMIMKNIGDMPSFRRIIDYSRGYYVKEIGGINTLVVFVTERYSEYKLVYSIPMNQISYGIANLRRLAFVLASISILVGTLAILVFSQSLYGPILTLKKAMLRFGQGDFSVRIHEARRDEFQVLYQGFNDMTEELTLLIDETIAQKLKIKEEHYRALQSQISPHFIYNTLNSIKCAAIIGKDDKVTEMLEAFIALLQLSVDHRTDMIPLKEEVNQVSNYVLLQKHRYGDLFHVIIEVDPLIEGYLVPKLILQPLVENSLNYGVNLREGKGLIYIKGCPVEDGIIIEVSDNGKEADVNKLRQILATKGKSKFSGIGIHNIHERIKLIYGERYGLSYEKDDERGLRAILYLGHRTMSHG